jgi:hypothetical protein
MKAPIVCLALGLALVTRVLALAGDLSEPGIAFPADFPQPAQLRIMESLKHPDCKFLGGRFVNWSTHLNYSGETKGLNQFLENLAKCPGVALSVRFREDKFDDGCDWVIDHTSGGDTCQLVVTVNLKSPRIKLADLMIPEAKGPPATEAK